MARPRQATPLRVHTPPLRLTRAMPHVTIMGIRYVECYGCPILMLAYLIFDVSMPATWHNW